MIGAAPERRSQGMAIGDVLSNKEFTKARHSGQPVWRNSYYKGQFEHRLWNRPFAGGSVKQARKRIGAIMTAAKELERRTLRDKRKNYPGVKNGQLGHVGLEVLELLYKNFLDYKTSRLDPAITTIAELTGRSYSAVHNALKRLRAAGFLHWIRRSEPTGNREGPQVVQVSNAYVMDLPAPVRKLVDWMMRKPPVPDDHQALQMARKQEHEDMLSRLSAKDWVKEIWEGDAAMGESWARIAALMDERESGKESETRPDILYT